MKRITLSTFLLLGCPSSDDGEQHEANAGTESASAGDETGPCAPGSAGCSCMNDMCLSPLVCLDEICTWSPPSATDSTDSDSGDDPGSDSSSSEGSSETGPTSCEINEDCFAHEVCRPDGTCAYAADSAFRVTVLNWIPSDCSGGPLEGYAELWWQLKIDDTVVGSSGWTQGGCPGHWEDQQICVTGGSLFGTFFLSALDEDNGTARDLMDVLWWDYDSDGVADPIDPEILHNRGYDGATGSGGHVELSFDVVDHCE